MSLTFHSPASPPDDVFAEILRASRALLAIRDPLDAEIVVSDLLGAWWGQRLPGTDLDRVLGEGLIGYAATAATPAAAALLAAMTSVTPSRRQRVMAGRAIVELAGQGVPRPEWARLIGAVVPGDCYVSNSRFGDTDDVICTFRYLPCDGSRDGDPPDEDRTDEDRTGDEAAGDERRGAGQPAGDTALGGHAVIAVIDHNAGGVLRDIWVTTKVDALVEQGRQRAERDPMATFTPLVAARARALLETAIARTDQALAGGAWSPHVAVGEASSLASRHALLRARTRALPSVGARRTTNWRRDRRATLAVRFLASDQAGDLSDSYTASRCVDHIIDYGCDVDARRPLRVSPRKVEAFLLSWLPRHVVLPSEEREAMPHVLAAWIRWAGPLTGLPPEAVGATLDALWETARAFTESYRDPAGVHGLRPEVVQRLLPDGALLALPRRMFAFPLLASDLLDGSSAPYDPTTPEGRRALLRLDHFNGQQPSTGKHSADTFEGSPELEEALDQHERLAKRLWDGDPPNLWAATQRLLDRGHTRAAVIEILLGVMADAEDTAALVKRLNDL